MRGEDGVALINELTVRWAIKEKLASPTVAVADTTAQEAAIGHPNEMGLMASFVASVALASRRAGRALASLARRAGKALKSTGKKVWGYRLKAKDASKAAKDRMTEEMAGLGGLNRAVGQALRRAAPSTNRLRKFGKVARRKLSELHQTMKQLLPQIRSWLRTGFVVPGKIVSVHIPQLYSIVGGKVGKAVEFGLNGGMTQIKGGFVLARRALDRKELVDTKFAVEAVKDHEARFGRAPRDFAYDRGGHSTRNVAALKKAGVKHVGLAPRGGAPSPRRAVADMERPLVKPHRLAPDLLLTGTEEDERGLGASTTSHSDIRGLLGLRPSRAQHDRSSSGPCAV
jgi:hypothetical protein